MRYVAQLQSVLQLLVQHLDVYVKNATVLQLVQTQPLA
jgi:hypothetical protein